MAHHDMMHLESFAEFLEVFCTQNYSALSQSRFHRKKVYGIGGEEKKSGQHLMLSSLVAKRPVL